MDPRAETYLRLLAEARLRRAVTAPHRIHLDQDFAIGGMPPREEGIYKVAAAARALELVGAVRPMPGIHARLLASGLTEVVDALETVGALTPDSPVTAGVAALCQRCGFDVGPVLATRAAAAHIPTSRHSLVLTDGYTPWPDTAPAGMKVVVGLLGSHAPEAPAWARTVRIRPE